MKLRKLSKNLVLIIIIVGCIVTINKYKDYIGQKKALQIEKQKIEDYSRNLRYNHILQDKEYEYLETSSNKVGKLSSKDKEVKFNTVCFSDSEEYMLTIINDSIVRLYCDIPLTKENKDFIKSIVHEKNKIISITFTKDKNIVFVNFLGEDKEKAYIIDLKSESVIWTMGHEFIQAYYKADTDSVIYVQTKNVSGSEIKENRYEIILDTMITNKIDD